MKMIDFENIDIVDVKGAPYETVNLVVEADVTKLGMKEYMEALEAAVQQVDWTANEVCFNVFFKHKMGRKDFTHFSGLVANMLVNAATTDEKRDRERRLGCPIAGNVSEMVLKKAINNVTTVDRMNVVCFCGNKNRRIV